VVVGTKKQKWSVFSTILYWFCLESVAIITLPEALLKRLSATDGSILRDRILCEFCVKRDIRLILPQPCIGKINLQPRYPYAETIVNIVPMVGDSHPHSSARYLNSTLHLPALPVVLKPYHSAINALPLALPSSNMHLHYSNTFGL
jgi:hypothetical protein